LLVLLGALLGILGSTTAEASHFRYGTIQWYVPDPVNAPLTVEFTVLHAWRISPYMKLNFGDGQSDPNNPGNAVGSGVDAGGLPYSVYKATTTHTYTQAKSYTAWFNSCCRIGPPGSPKAQNGANKSFRVEVTIDLNPANPPNLSGPVSSAPGFPVQMHVGSVGKYVFPVIDYDFDPVSCRIATNAEAGFSPATPTASVGNTIPQLKITPEGEGCEVTWDLTKMGAAQVGQIYVLPIMMESVHNGNTSATVIDFMIEMIAANAVLPQCSKGGVFVANRDQPVPFNHSVTGTDNQSSLKMTSINAPTGSSFAPAVGTTQASPFQTTFDWSPTAADIGTHVVQVNYTNSSNLSATCYMTILVPDCPDFGNACTLSVGECAANGKYICSAPGTKVCDAKPAAPNPELCDTLDNDCDGFTDEAFPELGDTCTVGVGECEASGLYICNAAQTGTDCDATPGTPSAELCDGLDNNCDGDIDEAFAGAGESCTVGVGSCAVIGKTVCTSDGSALECDATPGAPGDEVCGNSLDEDCDGMLDNGCNGTGGASSSTSSSGSGGEGAGSGSSSGSGGDNASNDSSADAGCSCTTAPQPLSPWPPLTLVALAAGWALRRRNRKGRARAWWRAAAPFCVMLLLLACGDGSGNETSSSSSSSSSSSGTGNTGGTPNPGVDTDGDTISDDDEGAAEQIDTDSDGTPDFKDLDSDDDGIPDAQEAGDGQLSTAPVDSDSDGTPDFKDEDSDDNGILDKDEGTKDTDGDTKGDWADLDNDGDNAQDKAEIIGAGSDCNNDTKEDAVGSAAQPADCDSDGTPNYMDLDSDGDNILDRVEGSGADTDSDTFLDRYDLDSDNDTLTDKSEAGDDDLATPPVDSDDDGIADFLDPDSDSDGLSDLDEAAAGTDSTKVDSDDDGVSDLIEVAAGTNPLDKADNPQAHGNFVFIVPYDEPTSPAKDKLEFGTSVQFADIYFGLDESDTMGAELDAMRGVDANTGVPGIIKFLSCDLPGAPVSCLIDTDCGQDQVCFNSKCIEDPLFANSGLGCIPDMWTGIGTFTTCNTFKNLKHIQPYPADTSAAIPLSTFSGGAEAVIQAAACVADSNICSNNNQCSAFAGDNSYGAVANPVGCVGYRPEAVRILVQITDADNQGGTCNGSVATIAAAGGALKQDGIKYVGLYGTGDDQFGPFELCNSPKECTDKLGVESDTLEVLGVSCMDDSACQVFPGSVCINNSCNRPFTLPALDSAVVQATSTAILQLVRGVPLNVTIAAEDVGGDAGDALQFIDYLEVNLSGGKCTKVPIVADTNMDNHDDSFPALPGGTPVCWDVNPVAKNTTVMPTPDPQLFKAKVIVSGDGSPLDERSVFFLVPPKPAEINPPN